MGNHNLLRIAILQQAVRDYQSALLKNDTHIAEELEKWFMSDWAQLLSGDMGEMIIKHCKARVNTQGRLNYLAKARKGEYNDR